MAEVKVKTTEKTSVPSAQEGDVWKVPTEDGEESWLSMVVRTAPDVFQLVSLHSGNRVNDSLKSLKSISRMLSSRGATLIGRTEDLVIEISVKEKGY